MLKSVSILLLFALALQCFSKLGVIAGYEINKSYIARVLCINRDKPAMHCDGKCYLKKKLQQDQQHKNNENGITGSKLDIVLFCSTEQFYSAPKLIKTSFTFPSMRQNVYQSPHFSFFHPPRMCTDIV